MVKSKYICLECDCLVFETHRDMGDSPYCPCCGGNDDTKRYVDKDTLDKFMKEAHEEIYE